MSQRRRSLVPLAEIGSDPKVAAETRLTRRIERLWPLIVGPALVHHTRLIRIRHRTLVMGCWKTEVMASLRHSVEATQPHVLARLKRLLGANLQHVEVVPCDPPQAAPPPRPAVADPFEAVLRKWRALRNQGWTLKRK